MEPIARLLTYCDSDAPTMSKVHYSMFLVQEAIEAVNVSPGMKAELLRLLRARWDYGFSALQGAGFVLDPEFWDCPADAETKAAFRTMVEKTYAYPPELDEDADAVAARDAECAEMRRKRAAAERQLSVYKARQGVFGREITIENALNMSAAEWWIEYGDEVPELQLVSVRVCGAVSGAGAAERGHKEMAFLLTKSRNRMQWPKAEKMLYVRVNENMMRKRQRIGYRVDVMNALDLQTEDEEEGEQAPLPSAWREAEEEAEAAFAAEADERTTRGASRGARAAAAKAHRRVPAMDNADAQQATRTGRNVRRPPVFDL
jgi:hypothetical protein